tara:strand:+ start:615 stop:1142 length:528 start_codon:yes stop_codon:yes gene_type:complete
MEWLGILLLYLFSGYMKKREQNKKRKEIESDPNWDSEIYEEQESTNLDLQQFFNDLFEQNPPTPELHPDTNDILKKENTEPLLDSELETIELENNSQKDINNQENQNNISIIDEQIDTFEDKIYHSKLSEKRELHYGKKWEKNTNLKKELFNTKYSLKKSIIIKEILDKPLGLRK